MMHKAIKVKMGRKQKTSFQQRNVNRMKIRGNYKFCGNRGKFINFVEIGGNLYILWK